MNLDNLLKEMKEKMQERDLSDKYLEENRHMTRTEMGIGEYGYGITTVPCEWVYDFLSDYKRVLKENEEWKRAYQEEKEEQFDLIKENYKLKNELENKRKEYQETYKDVREELKELRKENEELKKLMAHKNGYTKKLEQDLFENARNYVIPIQEVKDKIEELNQYYKKEIYPSLYQWADITITEHYDEMIELLQGLLEEGEKNG